MKPVLYCVVTALWLGVSSVVSAVAAEPMDTYLRTDALFEQGRKADACRALIASLGQAAPLSEAISPDEAELLLRLGRATSEYAAEVARRGERASALQAATTGMALSRQVMERPNATCADVQAGVALWLVAAEGLRQVWEELGQPKNAAEVGMDLAAMERLSSHIILPRCQRLPQPAVRRDARVETAEARALVRLWEYHLVRTAADNLD